MCLFSLLCTRTEKAFVFTFTVGFANNRNITIISPTNVKRQEALSQSFLGWPTTVWLSLDMLEGSVSVSKQNKRIGDGTKAAARQSQKNKIWRKTTFNMADGILIHTAMWHDHDIDFVRWLHPAVWHVALESWQWIHQMAAPCNVVHSSGMTCHWIRANVSHI